MASSQTTPHYGGQMGLVALLCMLCATGCVALNDQSGSLTLFPSWAQSSAASSTPVLQASTIQVASPAATFIVRFNDEQDLDFVCRNFRRDETATRAAYERWASGHRQLTGLHLVRASYSGELVLALPRNDPQSRSPRDVIAALETMNNLAYAEIDSVASASDGS